MYQPARRLSLFAGLLNERLSRATQGKDSLGRADVTVPVPLEDLHTVMPNMASATTISKSVKPLLRFITESYSSASVGLRVCCLLSVVCWSVGLWLVVSCQRLP